MIESWKLITITIGIGLALGYLCFILHALDRNKKEIKRIDHRVTKMEYQLKALAQISGVYWEEGSYAEYKEYKKIEWKK